MGTGEAVEAGGGGTQKQYYPQTAERLAVGGGVCVQQSEADSSVHGVSEIQRLV